MKTLPEYVRPFMAQLHAEELLHGIRSDPALLETLAWRRWAKTLTNRELGEIVMFIRAGLVQEGNNPLGVKLEEIWRRLKR
ncbi:MAG: hypothetical protein FD161_3025 [Limisphaerales bacterium]|nr:MAG: hypothetical protein FD161_3025 [Limisphaerales bacterium]KAG0508138.1 MAG: hypothetical protein E1N63_2732 [Limisphaerales bacterium]TXT53009.1 MAG: hypothetical protein FD140_117 [Limisphaerales bacterium]